MRKLHLLAFLAALLSVTCLQSQNLPLIALENFSDNHNRWVESFDDIGGAELKDGKYVMKLLKDDYYYRFWNTITDTNTMLLKQEIIIFRVRQTAGDDNAEFGIIWDSDAPEKCHEFLISSGGYYKIRTRINDDYISNVKWTKTSVVKPKGEYNELTVIRHGGYYDFYINRYRVARLSVSKLGVFGNDVGFILLSKATVEADYIKIYGQSRKLNIIPSPIKAEKINLGPAVNTGDIEISPLITADGKHLYFVRRTEEGDDDIYVSVKKDGKWTQAVRLGPPFNDAHNNSVEYVSTDGNIYIVSGLYDNGVYISQRGLSKIQKLKDGSFSLPQPVFITDYENEWDYYSFTFSQDKSVLIMAVQRTDDCFGGSDLYVSFLQSDGTYSTPKNLGADINTPLNEGTPFLAPDGVTLYFSSAGHPGFGDRDIFVSRRLDDTWQHWSEPQNLGPSINTPGWDAYFTIDAKGEYAYLVSNDNSTGGENEDIFMIPLSQEARPEPVAVVTGKVLDSLTSRPVFARIYYNTTSGELKDYTVSDANDGSFKVVLPLGKKYFITASANGYLNKTLVLDLPYSDTVITMNLSFLLEPIKVGQSVVLDNVYFPAGQDKFLPQSYAALDKLVLFMKQNPNVKIEISGHTNNIGDYDKLVDLSVRRAEAVKRYLVSKGIDSSRIVTKGYGPDKPIADNSTLKGRRLNQRVEVKILSNE